MRKRNNLHVLFFFHFSPQKNNGSKTKIWKSKCVLYILISSFKLSFYFLGHKAIRKDRLTGPVYSSRQELILLIILTSVGQS